MTETKKMKFNPDAAEEYFSMLLTSYRDTANDIFRRDNEGRDASNQHYSSEYQKYVGMQIAMREVLEYFGEFDLDEWIPVEDERKPSDRREYFIAYVFGDSDMHFFGASMYHAHEGNGLVNRPHFSNEGVDEMRVTHWMEIPRLPAPIEEEAHEDS